MRTGLFITARLKSTRLPLKLLAKIQGKETIRHVIARAKQVSGIDRIVLCTSTNPQDMPLTDIAIEEGVSYYCGDPDDVLVRLRDAGKFFGVDNFISVTADNPLFCVYHANQASEALRKNPSIDYLYFTGLPIGAFVYALRTKFLDVVCSIKDQADTEIWGPFVNRPDIFKVENLKADPAYNINARLTLDHPKDLMLLEKIGSEIEGNFQNITLFQIADLLKSKPEIGRGNIKIQQNTVSDEALKEIDRIYNDNIEDIKNLMVKFY